MKILIACEESGTVRDAFINKGHDTISCDLQPGRGIYSEKHYCGDVFDLIGHYEYDIIIAHPPCTYLTVTANKWLKDQPERKSGALVGKARRDARQDAIAFFMSFIGHSAKLCIENPIGCMSSVYRKPDQIIQPYQYGHAERKATCLWLYGLGPLIPTNIVEPVSYIAAGKKYSPTHYNSKRSLNRLDCLPPGAERSKLRSVTYQGIADAMANQWG